MTTLTADPPTDTPPVTPPTDSPPPADDWRATLPDDLKADKTLAQYKDLPSALKGFVETKKLVGQKTDGMVKMPGADAKPEETAAWRKALGVPDTADGYHIDLPQVNGIAWEQGTVESFKATAHKFGLAPDVAQGLVGWYADMQAQVMQTTRERWVKDLDTIRTEWGEATFARRATLASRAVAYLEEQGGAKGLRALLDQTGLGDHPVLFRAFTRLGEDFAEDGIIRTDTAAGGMTKEDALAQAQKIDDEIRKLPEGDPRRTALADKILDLYRIAYGSQEVTRLG